MRKITHIILAGAGAILLNFLSTIPLVMADAITLPESLPTQITNGVSGQLSDEGQLLFLVVCAGLPFAFVIFHELLNIFPDIREHRKKYGEFG